MGRAINKAVTIAEIIKRKLPVHQLNQLASVEMIDVYTPLEEGLDQVTSRRFVSCIKITLSLSATVLDTFHYGYQPPLLREDMSLPMGRGADSSFQPRSRHQRMPHPHHHHASQYQSMAGGDTSPRHSLMYPHA
jgi:hypothetical protein